MAISILPFSSSVNGQPIKIAATVSPGTFIHRAISGTSQLDELFIYAQNGHTASVEVTIEFGGTTNIDHTIKQTIAVKDGLTLIVPGIPLQNDLFVRAFAGTTNVVSLLGYVQRGP